MTMDRLIEQILDLNDIPHSYAGFATYGLAVNAGEDAMEFSKFATEEFVALALGAFKTFFLSDTGSGVGALNYAYPHETGEAQSTIVTAGMGLGDGQLIRGFITEAGEPNTTTIHSGLFIAHFHAKKGASNQRTTVLYAVLSRVDADGTSNKTAVSTFEISPELTNAEAQIEIHGSLGSDIDVAATSRWILDVYANVGSGAQDSVVTLYMEGSEDSYFTGQVDSGIWQTHSDVLDDLNTLGAVAADGEFIVGTGAGAFAYESGATARASMGVYSIAESDGLIIMHQATYNHANYDTAYGWGDHAGLYLPIGGGTLTGALEVRSSSSILRLRDTGAIADATLAYVEFGGTEGGNWHRTGYIGDASSGDTDIYLHAEESDLHLGDSSGHSVLNLQGGNVGIGLATIDANYKLIVRRAANVNFGIGLQGAELAIAAFNDAISANVPMRFYASEFNFINGYIGFGVIDPDTKVEIFNAGNQLKLSFDGTDHAIFAVDTAGVLTITPSGAAIDFASKNLTGVNLVLFPDNLADALSFKNANGDVFQKFISTTGELAVEFPQTILHVGGGTIQDWDATQHPLIQLGAESTIYAPGDTIGFVQNARYNDTDNRWEYISNRGASSFYSSSGSHYFRVAGVGAVDAEITWIIAMTVRPDGGITLGAAIGDATPIANTFYKDTIIKGWIKWETVNPSSVLDSFNVDSITDIGVGRTTITWDVDFANTTYCVVASSEAGYEVIVDGQGVGAANVKTWNSAGAAIDSANNYAIAVGDQA